MRSRTGCRARSSAPRPTSNGPKPEYEAARVRAPRMQRRLPPRKGGGVGAAVGPPHPRGGEGGRQCALFECFVVHAHEWCRARPIKGPGLSRLRGVITPPPSLAVRPYILPLHTISHLGGGWWSPAVRAFGGGSPVREVGTSSCWAPPPSRQPQCGSAAPCHGRLGATARWGDKVRVEGPANGRSLDRS